MSIKTLRKSKGLTSYQLATSLGVSQGHLSHLERGTRRISDDQITKMAEILGIDEHTLKIELENIKPYATVLNSWVWKIRFGDKPVLDAFKEDLELMRMRDIHDEAVDRFIKFILYNIGDSIKEEFQKDEYMKEYLIERIT
jgi:transcriptional regulator with XRE-family HTH domain